MATLTHPGPDGPWTPPSVLYTIGDAPDALDFDFRPRVEQETAEALEAYMARYFSHVRATGEDPVRLGGLDHVPESIADLLSMWLPEPGTATAATETDEQSGSSAALLSRLHAQENELLQQAVDARAAFDRFADSCEASRPGSRINAFVDLRTIVDQGHVTLGAIRQVASDLRELVGEDPDFIAGGDAPEVVARLLDVDPSVLSSLPGHDATVLRLMYGHRRLTRAQVADYLGVTSERVTHLHEQALMWLRHLTLTYHDAAAAFQRRALETVREMQSYLAQARSRLDDTPDKTAAPVADSPVARRLHFVPVVEMYTDMGLDCRLTDEGMVLRTRDGQLIEFSDDIRVLSSSEQDSKKPEGMDDWIARHGSTELRDGLRRGYNVTGSYARERAAAEFPEFLLRTRGPLNLHARVNPSAAALAVESRAIRRAQELGHDVTVRIRYAKDPVTVDDMQITGEVVCIDKYLGRYQLVLPVASAPEKPRPARRAPDVTPTFELTGAMADALDAEPLVIAVTSPKGGVGKSTTAVNMAAAFAGALPAGRVLVVDGDLSYGTGLFRHAQSATPNLMDLLRRYDSLRSRGDSLNDYVRDVAPFVFAPPQMANVDMLGAPDAPGDAAQIDERDLERLLGDLKRHYQVIVIDCGAQLDETHNQVWLRNASQVYFMVEPKNACLDATADYLRRAAALDIIDLRTPRVICIRANMQLDDGDDTPAEERVRNAFLMIPGGRLFLIEDFHRDALKVANRGGLLAWSSQQYYDQVARIVMHAAEAHVGYATASERQRRAADEMARWELDDALADPRCEEIHVRGTALQVKFDGQDIVTSGVSFYDEIGAIAWIEDTVAQAGGDWQRIRENCSGLLQTEEGHRMVVFLPPMADKPEAVIRKRSTPAWTLQSLPEAVAGPELRRLLSDAVAARANILVCGDEGAGKTALLSALMREIPADDPVVVVDSGDELPRLAGDKVTRFDLSARESASAADVLDLQIYAPTARIVVGESRTHLDVAALLRALNARDGSMTTYQADEAERALAVIADQVALAQGVDADYALAWAASAFDLVVVMHRVDGEPRIVQAAETTPDGETRTLLSYDKAAGTWTSELPSSHRLADKLRRVRRGH